MSRTRTLLLVVGLLVGGIVMAGCTVLLTGVLLLRDSDLGSNFEEATFASLDDWPAATTFADNFELVFPPSTRDIRLASDGFQEPIYQFRLTVDPDELPLLTDSIGCNGLLSQPASSAPGAIIDEPLDWWVPADAATYGECAGSPSPGRAQQVFIDLTDPAGAQVYILVIYF